MPDSEAIRRHAVATAPEFLKEVARAFAFLTSTRGYCLASQDITAINDMCDTQVAVSSSTTRWTWKLTWSGTR
jgi:hypothetical protein